MTELHQTDQLDNPNGVEFRMGHTGTLVGHAYMLPVVPGKSKFGQTRWMMIDAKTRKLVTCIDQTDGTLPAFSQARDALQHIAQVCWGADVVMVAGIPLQLDAGDAGSDLLPLKMSLEEWQAWHR